MVSRPVATTSWLDYRRIRSISSPVRRSIKASLSASRGRQPGQYTPPGDPEFHPPRRRQRCATGSSSNRFISARPSPSRITFPGPHHRSLDDAVARTLCTWPSVPMLRRSPAEHPERCSTQRYSSPCRRSTGSECQHAEPLSHESFAPGVATSVEVPSPALSTPVHTPPPSLSPGLRPLASSTTPSRSVRLTRGRSRPAARGGPPQLARLIPGVGCQPRKPRRSVRGPWRASRFPRLASSSSAAPPCGPACAGPTR